MNKWTFLVVLLVVPVITFAQQEARVPTVATGRASDRGVPQRSVALRAAVFVQNRAGVAMEGSVPMFRELLTARLTEKGFSIIDGHDVAERLKETEGAPDPVVGALRDIAKGVESAKTEASVEQVLNGASALRIAQMLGANYLIIATLVSVGSERSVFHGEGTLYKSDNVLFTRSLRTSLRVLEGNRGSTVYGDTVRTQGRLMGNKHLTTVTDDGDSGLIDQAASVIADNIAAQMERIRNTDVEAQSAVQVEVRVNVDGATVELDGAALGSAPGRFAIRPGIHEIAISKERYVTWRKTVNVVPNQVFNVTLERSAVGEERNEDALRVAREEDLTRKTTEAGIEISKEQSAADAYAKRQVAEGEKEYRKKSHTQIEGPVHDLNIGRSPDVNVKVERE